MSLHEQLGVRRIINAAATLTKLGGSLMPPEVWEAMQEAGRSFVDIHALQRRIGEHIAEATHNEAAYVCAGAATGLVLTTAACVTGLDEAAAMHLPDLTGLKDEVIVHRTQRNPYDRAVRQAGVKLVEIGSPEGTQHSELEGAISDRTAAVLWFQGAMTGRGDLPLELVIDVASAHGVPVIVDAAAQLPPVKNLWRFTQMGAALAVFSGGKDLRGPQATGLIVGRQDLVEACRLHGSPNAYIGRTMKVSKEEMAGLLAAVERYLRLDHAARERHYEQVVEDWCAALNRLPGVRARRDFPNEAGQPLPWCLVTVDPAHAVCRDTAVSRLESGEPSIAVLPCGPDAFHLNPMTLEPGEEHIVLDRVVRALTP